MNDDDLIPVRLAGGLVGHLDWEAFITDLETIEASGAAERLGANTEGGQMLATADELLGALTDCGKVAAAGGTPDLVHRIAYITAQVARGVAELVGLIEEAEATEAKAQAAVVAEAEAILRGADGQ